MPKMWATVVTVNGNKIKVVFDNGQESNKEYRYPKTGYTPAAGDRALFDDNICLGIY